MQNSGQFGVIIYESTTSPSLLLPDGIYFQPTAGSFLWKLTDDDRRL